MRIQMRKKAGWTHSVFGKMTWGTDDYFLPYMQAIKWNTYKHAFKQHYNKVRATVISNLKQHLISGKFDFIYILYCINYSISELTIIT